MAGRLPSVRNGEVVAALEKDGWYVARTTGHVQMRHPTKPGTASVPNHPSDQTAPPTLRRILKQAGLTVDEFQRLL